ncbi:transposase [Lichenibacterium minor]|uniref:transposase n=1 Tax=Lichenibacterium minor TaxID=2316528 RepID=UPI0013EC80CE|nr:transposase [Lichenibacterium minor]
MVRRSPNAVALEVIELRWRIERTFSWLCRSQRLAKNFEHLTSTLLAFIALAAI